MKLKNDDGSWNPYIAGVLLGVLAIVSVFATTQLIGKTEYLGASTTFVRAAGLIEQTIAPDHVAANKYFTSKKVAIDWQFMLVLGIFLGALLSSLSDKNFSSKGVPPMWSKEFGPSIAFRAVAAFVGGLVLILGARMAGGCLSGHMLSGLMKLSVSGFVAAAVFFGFAALAARIIWRKS